MQTVKTCPSTKKTTNSPDKMARWGNAGNTVGTRLPKNGAPKGKGK